jgi:hypothetical protein
MICEHCQGEFIAADDTNPRNSPQQTLSVLERATLLLESLEAKRVASC